MQKEEIKIKEGYEELKQLVVSARITVRTKDDMLLDYPVYGDLILRDITEDDCLFMEDRVKAVIKMQSVEINKFSALGKDLIFTNRRMKSVLGGNITYFWQNNVNAILCRGDGVYCFGRTLREAIRCCKLLEKLIREYFNML